MGAFHGETLLLCLNNLYLSLKHLSASKLADQERGNVQTLEILFPTPSAQVQMSWGACLLQPGDQQFQLIPGMPVSSCRNGSPLPKAGPQAERVKGW